MSKEEYLEELSNELQISKNMLNKYIYIVGTNKENIKDYSLNSGCAIVRKNNGFNISYTAEMLNYKDQKIADLEAKLAEKDERINWLVEAEFNRKWAKKYVEMRRKEDPMLCLPDSDEVYEKYFELKQQLETQENTITNLVEDNRASQEWYKKQLAESESRFQAHKQNDARIIQDQTDLIENLKQQLAESEEFLVATKWKVQDLNKQLSDTEEQNKRVLEKLELIVSANQELEQQLAEKEKERHEEWKTGKEWKWEWQKVNYKLEKAEQNKISFCIEQLEKVKEYAIHIQGGLINYIDNQIKQLKEGK